MKKTFLAFLVTTAILAVLGVFNVAASDVVSIDLLQVNGLDVKVGNYTADNIAVEAGDIVPVRIEFTSNTDAEEVEVFAYIRGDRSKGTGISKFADLIDGKKYVAKLSLQIPERLEDNDATEEERVLVVEIETNEGNVREEYTLNVQRKSDNVRILFVDAERKVEAGSTLPVDLVIKNLGRSELEDLVVKVALPQLGIEKRAYFGDLTPIDGNDKDEDNPYSDKDEDAREKRVYLRIPVNVESGIYDLVVEAYGEETEDRAVMQVEIVGSEESTKVLLPVVSKELITGEKTTYEMVLVNPTNKIGVYEIVPETAEGIIVNVNKPVVTVPAGSSQVVGIDVEAGSRDGTYSFAVNVNSEDKLVKRVVMNAVVKKGTVVGTNGTTILTIILGIIFVVLLVVLIVLLTRKPEKAEELEESYY